MRKTGERRFLGMLDTRSSTLRAILIDQDKLPETEEESRIAIRYMRNFQKKHLKAYLRGYTDFTYFGEQFEVRQEWTNRQKA